MNQALGNPELGKKSPNKFLMHKLDHIILLHKNSLMASNCSKSQNPYQGL